MVGKQQLGDARPMVRWVTSHGQLVGLSERCLKEFCQVKMMGH